MGPRPEGRGNSESNVMNHSDNYASMGRLRFSNYIWESDVVKLHSSWRDTSIFFLIFVISIRINEKGSWALAHPRAEEIACLSQAILLFIVAARQDYTTPMSLSDLEIAMSEELPAAIINAYREINVPADALPYTSDFELLYEHACNCSGAKLSRAQMWRRVCHLRKKGLLPRLCR